MRWQPAGTRSSWPATTSARGRTRKRKPMSNNSNGTFENSSGDVSRASADSGPAVAEPSGPPTPLDDFTARLKACREMGVTELHDGQLHVLFSPLPRAPRPSEEVLALVDRARADAAMRGG